MARCPTLRRTLLLALSLAAATSCFEPEGDPTPLPSWALKKSFFDAQDTWWLQRTVISVQSDQLHTYPGDGDINDQIRWKIERDYLFAVRNEPLIRSDSPDKGQMTEAENIVLAFPILMHFDVVNGQIIERPKSEWYEREWFYVDWGNQLIPEYRFQGLLANRLRVDYMVEDPNDPNHPIFPSEAAPDYLDFTTHVLLDPVMAINPFDNSVGHCTDPGWNWDYLNCAPLNVGFRTALRRIPKDYQYEPLFNTTPDRAPGWGAPSRFFKHSILFNSEPYGITTGDHRVGFTRYNIWKQSYAKDGTPLPYREREVAPVVFYLSENFPEDLKDEIERGMEAWDSVLVDVVRDLRAWECRDEGGSPESCLAEAEASKPDDVLVLCKNNPVKAGDPAPCGKPGFRARLGDLRYHFIDWTTIDILGMPSAFTWWSVDVPTGGSIHSHVVLAAGRINRIAAWSRDAVLLAAGRPLPDVPSHGLAAKDLTRWREMLEEDRVGRHERVLGLEGSGLGSDVVRFPEPVELPPGTEGPAFSESVSPFLSRAGMLEPLLGSSIEQRLLDPEDLIVHGVYARPGSELDFSPADFSPLRKSYRQVLGARTEGASALGAHGRHMEAPLELDVGYYVEAFAELSPNEILAELRSQITEIFFLHELGHALGLRHNFAASYDALNYVPEYWDARRADCVGKPRYVPGCELTQAEVDAGLHFSSYSSVMDYSARIINATRGLGPYDRAAIYALYGKMVPVFRDPALADDPDASMLIEALYNRFLVGFPLYWEEDASAPNGYRPRSFHFSRFPSILGDLHDREFVPARHLHATDKRKHADGRWVVPFLACEDTERGIVPHCNYFDQGADPYEVTQQRFAWFKLYYPINNFRNGKLEWQMNLPEDTFLDRLFKPAKLFNDWWVTYLHDFRDYPETFNDPDFFEPHKKAVELGFNQLVQVLATPEYGPHDLVALPDGTSVYQTWQEAVSYLPPPDFAPGDIVVPIPEGKEYRSAMFVEGTNFYLGNIGSFVEKELALEALMDPAYFLFPGRNTWDPVELWMTNHYNSFPLQMLDVLGSVVVGDTERLAPRWHQGRVVYRDYTDLHSTAPGTALSPAIGFNLRLRALVYGMSLIFKSYSDRTLLDLARVWPVGSGEEVVTAQPVVAFVHPATGKTYQAISYIQEGIELGIGARLIERANDLAQRLEDAELDGLDDEEIAWLDRELRRAVDLMEAARSIARKLDDSGYDTGR